MRRSFVASSLPIVLGSLALVFASGCTVVLEVVDHDVPSTDSSVRDVTNEMVVADGSDTTTPIDAMDDTVGMDGDLDVIGSDADDSVDLPIPTDGVVVDACGPEICNGLDDDCDGVIDNIAPITCGVGACARTIPACTNGAQNTCAPGQPGIEVCNGLDDDCDGAIDDNIAPLPSCGLGICTAPATACSNGVPATCTPHSIATNESCNGLDDNCNGVVDEGCGCNVFVAPTGDSSAPGTSPTAPTNSILHALQTLDGNAGRICVAANGVNTCTPAYYSEAFTIPNGVSIVGGYHPGSWMRSSGCDTVIVVSQSPGVTFASSATRSAQLVGFGIRVGNAATSNESVAIAMVGGGTVAGNNIQGTGAWTGIRVFDSSALVPLISANSIIGADSTTPGPTALGIDATRNVEVRGNTIATGAAAMYSIGIRLTNAAGSIISDNGSRGGPAPLSAGLKVTGNAAGVIVTRNTLSAGFSSAPSGTPAAGSFGIEAVQCNGQLSVTRNQSIQAFTAALTGNGASEQTGILADSCDVAIIGNPSIAGGTTTGRSLGIHCANNARCAVSDNTISGISAGAAGNASAGFGILAETGALLRADRNVVSGCAASRAVACTGIALASTNDASVLSRNSLAGQGVGIIGSDTRARIENNRLVVSGDGIVVDAIGHQHSPIVTSNTVIGANSGARLLVVQPSGDGNRGPAGVFTNNIAFCAGGTSATLAFAALVQVPEVLVANDLAGCTTLYSAGTMDYTDINAINATSTPASRVAMNFSADPTIDATFHLAAGSPCIDRGTFEFAPANDLDGDGRPINGRWDVGCDEFR